ncbi:helix-turn-helix domain-containing protein [Cohnella sp.]|uniref:helix-turn-helix domain-containing protein n=1 Tax=Cohnella sp. TaxID=1883426 RepID=UPI003563D12E
MDKSAALREPMPMPDPSFPVKLHQCRANEIGSTLFPHHWHEHMEFMYFMSGTATIECGSTSIQPQVGDLIVVNSNELHYGISTSSDLFYYVMIVDISLLHSYSVDAVETKFITPISQNRILFQNRISQDENITECIVSLIREMLDRELGYELSIKSHLYRLLSLLVRKYVAAATDLDQYRLRLRDLERLAPVFRHIDEYYPEKLTVQQLADQTGLSRFHFSRLFKQLTDKSLVEYINLIRINKSEELLRNTRMNISEIALATGFNDIYYFSRTFRKLKNVSPTQWRNFYP